MSNPRLIAIAIAVVGLAGGAAAGCDSAAGTCVGPEIYPHQSPVHLGSLRPLAPGEVAAPGSPEAVPFELTLFLQSPCSAPLEITKVCIVGDAHNGDEGDHAFTIEGPVPATVGQGGAAALRLTYDSAHVNRDRDSDGVRDADNVAVVVQSNATNFPTLVVPVCAAIIPAGEDVPSFGCVSPVTVPAGESNPGLCP